MVRHLLLDGIHCDELWGSEEIQFFQGGSAKLQGDRLSGHTGIGTDPIVSAFQLPDIAGYTAGNEQDHVIGEKDTFLMG